MGTIKFRVSVSFKSCYVNYADIDDIPEPQRTAVMLLDAAAQNVGGDVCIPDVGQSYVSYIRPEMRYYNLWSK